MKKSISKSMKFNLFFLFFIFMIFTQHTYGADENESWTKISFEKKINSHLKIDLSQGLRLNEQNTNLKLAFFEGSILYKGSNGIKIGIPYRYTILEDKIKHRLSLEASYQLSYKYLRLKSRLEYYRIYNNENITISFNVSGLAPIKATIVWNDPAGTPVTPQNNPTTSMLVNDLDIRLNRSSNNETFYPWVMQSNVEQSATTGDNIVDNVEQVFLNNPLSGEYVLTVSHKGNLLNNSQSFSLILTTSDFSNENYCNNECYGNKKPPEPSDQIYQTFCGT